MFTVVAKGFEELLAELHKVKRQIPFATAQALTSTAKLVKAEIEKEMHSVFDRPTRWTLNSLRLLPAKKDMLRARVWVKDEADGNVAPAEKWLLPQVEGGDRQDKRSEVLLRKRWRLPADKFAAPAKGARLDRFGNMSRGQIQKILSGLGAQLDAYQNSTDSRRSRGNKKRYFVMRRGRDPIGIAERTSRARMAVVLAYVGKPSYKRRLDFYGIGNRVVAQHLDTELGKALERALSGSRPGRS